VSTSLAAEVTSRRVDYIGLSTYTSAAICAGLEIAEDARKIGHGHGIVLLTLSKMFKEVAEVSRKTRALSQNIPNQGAVLDPILKPLTKILSNSYIIGSLAVTALYAAFTEVMEGLEIGGHHGTLFLAIHEIIELLEESPKISKLSLAHSIFHNSLLKITLLSGAFVVSLLETLAKFESKQIRAHHGILILSSMKTISAARKLIKEQDEEKKD